jgi:hypothetical protein
MGRKSIHKKILIKGIGLAENSGCYTWRIYKPRPDKGVDLQYSSFWRKKEILTGFLKAIEIGRDWGFDITDEDLIKLINAYVEATGDSRLYAFIEKYGYQ